MLQVSISTVEIRMASVPCRGPWQGGRGQGGSHPRGHRSPPRGVVFVKHILLCKPQETLRANSGCPVCGKLQPTQLWVPSSSWLWVCTPLSYHRQWWIKACVPYNNTKLSTYSQFIQPRDVMGVDLIIQQFGYFPDSLGDVSNTVSTTQRLHWLPHFPHVLHPCPRGGCR